MTHDPLINDRTIRLLTARRIVILAITFILPLAALNRLLRWVDNHVVDFDRPPYWPIGVFEPRWPGWTGLAIAAACAAYFVLSERALRRRGYPLLLVTLCGLLLVLGTNLIHGPREGLETPIAGGDPAIQYYHDSLRITSAADFVANYTELQPSLLDHARTHPPGAVLVMYGWHRLIAGVGPPMSEPALISMLVTLIATIASAYFLHGLLARHVQDRALVGWTTFTYLLLPAVQIYYCASIDALIAAAFLGVIYFLGGRDIASRCALVASLFASSFLTFAVCFLPPVMLAYEYSLRRSARRSLIALVLTLMIYAWLAWAGGFNYAQSFRIAATLENPHGFRLLYESTSYVFTRLECVLEIAVFLGPFVAWALWHRLIAGANPVSHATAQAPDTECCDSLPLRAAHRAALITLAGMFLTGAFHTAETARACLFIYPFLLLPLADHSRTIRSTEKKRLAALVFGQTLVMQMFGNYFW